jgi:hypothetical protein
MKSEKIKPGKQWYILSLLILIAGITIFTVLLISGISGMQKGSQRFIVPGTRDVVLSEQGKYIIYYEHDSVIDGAIYVTDRNISGLRCTLKNKATGQRIQISDPSVNSRYSFGGHEGVSVLEFTIHKAGTYELNAGYGDNNQGQKVVLAINKGMTGRTVLVIVIGIIAFIATLIASIIIFIFTIIKRKKIKSSSPIADFTENNVL